MSSLEELLQKKPKTNKEYKLKAKIKKRAVKDNKKKIEELKLQISQNIEKIDKIIKEYNADNEN